MGKIKKFGVCRYCGQSRIVEPLDPDAVTQDDLDKMATASCSCPVAKAKRNEVEQMAAAEEYIRALSEELIKDGDQERTDSLRRVMTEAVSAVWDEVVDKADFKVGGKSVRIHRTTDKIKFKTSWRGSSEVEF